MAFADVLREIPNTYSTGEGTGLTISILKALNHVSLLLANEEPTEEFQLAEAQAIATHLNNAHLIHPTAASNEFGTLLGQLGNLGTMFWNEFEGWDAETRTRNIIELNNRIGYIMLRIDNELAGIPMEQLATGDRL